MLYLKINDFPFIHVRVNFFQYNDEDVIFYEGGICGSIEFLNYVFYFSHRIRGNKINQFVAFFIYSDIVNTFWSVLYLILPADWLEIFPGYGLNIAGSELRTEFSKPDKRLVVSAIFLDVLSFYIVLLTKD